MMRKIRFTRSAFLAALCLTFTGSAAPAALVINISPSATAMDDGSTRYVYVLGNDASSTLAAIQLQIGVGPNANPFDVTGPAGWDFLYDATFDVVTWFSAGTDTDILSG